MEVWETPGRLAVIGLFRMRNPGIFRIFPTPKNENLRFLETKSQDRLFPEWHIWESYVGMEQQGALQLWNSQILANFVSYTCLPILEFVCIAISHFLTV